MPMTSTNPLLTMPLAVRWLCGAIAAIVAVDAIAVGAPGLALLAVPFLAAAVLVRREATLPMVAVLVIAASYVLLGVNYAIANGFDAEWGDLLFAYAGTPAAVAAAGLAARSLLQHRSTTLEGGGRFRIGRQQTT